MCVGNLFSPPKPPPAPPRMKPAPTQRAPAPPPEMPTPERIKDETGEVEAKMSTRKKKALEVKKVQEGVKQLGAVDPATMPSAPPGGIAPPSGQECIMCVAQAEQFTGGIRNIRDNVNAVTGWGNPGTRGERTTNVNVYNRLPGGDITPAKDSLKVKGGGKK